MDKSGGNTGFEIICYIATGEYLDFYSGKILFTSQL